MYENIEFNYSNFCIGALVDTFCSVDVTNYPTCLLQIKNDTGTTQGNYTLSESVGEDGIVSLEYFGPRGLSSLVNGLPFWTLERISSNQCKIREWELNITLNTLDLQQSITKTTTSGCYFDCYDMSLEYYQLGIEVATATGTGYIRVGDTSHIDIGDNLYIGPSSNVSYLGDFEKVNVTSISGTYVFIEPTISGSYISPSSVFNSGDKVCFAKNVFLFSDSSQYSDQGSFITLDMGGNVVDVITSGIFSGVRASSFGLPYGNTVGFVKNSNIYYMDISDYEIKKSAALTNILADDVTLIPIYDIAFTDTSLYRLQDRVTRRNDDGTRTNYIWSTYNFCIDGVYSYTDSITMWAEPSVIGNQDGTTIYALVRDQYGGVLSGKTVYFNKTSGDANGIFDDPNEQADTDVNGVAQIGYTSGWYDPSVVDGALDSIHITGYTDGSNPYTGSQYVWDAVELLLHKKFISELPYMLQIETTSGTWPTEGSSLYSQTYLEQIERFESQLYLPGLSKFQFPGGHWLPTGEPEGQTALIVQLYDFESELLTRQIESVFNSDVPLLQYGSKSNDGKVDQVYISRHLTGGHKDTAQVAQFRFVVDALPPFWSEKNARDTNIWIKIAPYGFSLNQSTLVFKVREVSLYGDSGYVNYANTAFIDVSTWDAGGGLLGLNVTVNPPNDFYNNSTVYVFLQVYDQAVVPNIIEIDYWFKIVPDFQAPYIENESPGREAVDVTIDTNIEFDILDVGMGVDMSTFEFYINNRQKFPVVTQISNGYHIFYDPTSNFSYNQEVEITVRVKDKSDYQNTLYDMWRFYVIGSEGPWFDPESFYPTRCAKGVNRKVNPISFNVYEIDNTGIDASSIRVFIGGRERNVIVTPIVYRLN